MEEEILNQLEAEISREISNLEGLEPGSDAQTAAIENLSKMYKLLLEEKKLGAEMEKHDAEINIEQQKINADILKHDKELEAKKEELKQNKENTILHIAADVGMLLAQLGHNGIWLRRGFRFEETGHVNSFFLKSLVGGIFRFK